MFYNNPDTPAHTHTGRDTQMSSSMSPVAPAGEINMQSSTKLSGTHKHTWKEPREGRGEGIALRAEESPGEKIYILQAKKSEAGGRRPQTGEGVYRGRGFSGKKKGKVKEKNALDWEKINCWREDLIQDVSRNHSDCCQTGTLSFFTTVLLTLRLQVAMVISITVIVD